MTDQTNETPVGTQDPLPENSWLWRRVYTYLMSVMLLGVIAYVLISLAVVQDATGLRDIGLRLCWLLLAVITYYLVAPSAEQIVHLVQAARISRANILSGGGPDIGPGDNDPPRGRGLPDEPSWSE